MHSQTTVAVEPVWTAAQAGQQPASGVLRQASAGLKSKFVVQSMSSQLGDTIVFNWQLKGFVVTLRMNKAWLEM